MTQTGCSLSTHRLEEEGIDVGFRLVDAVLLDKVLRGAGGGVRGRGKNRWRLAM